MPIFLAIISHFNEIFTKGGKISKKEVTFYQIVTSYGKIYLKEHDFFQR